MVLVTYFNLELDQIDIKTAFLNGNIDETIYIVQSEKFILEDPKNMIYKFKKFIYGFKQASRQWFSNSQKWIDTMSEEIKSMKNNDIWYLVPLPEGAKFISCK